MPYLRKRFLSHTDYLIPLGNSWYNPLSATTKDADLMLTTSIRTSLNGSFTCKIEHYIASRTFKLPFHQCSQLGLLSILKDLLLMHRRPRISQMTFPAVNALVSNRNSSYGLYLSYYSARIREFLHST